VKSFLGERLEEVRLGARGVAGDRVFAVRDTNGKLGTGKTTRRFRLLCDLFDLSAETDRDAVVVRAPGDASFRVGEPELDEFPSTRDGERLAVMREEAVSHFDAGPMHLLTTSSLRWMESAYGRAGGDARRLPAEHRARHRRRLTCRGRVAGRDPVDGSSVLQVTGRSSAA
jgi:uncharacterized protein YcbX